MGFYRVAKQWFGSRGIETSENVVRLRRLSNFFKQLPVYNGYYWNKDRQQLGQLLAGYFEDLASNAEIKLKFQMEPSHGYLQGTRDFLRIRFTVEQLGLMIRVMKDTNVIAAMPTTQVIRFCISHLLMDGKREGHPISFEYLKACINKSRPEVYDFVEQRLNDMIVSLRRLSIQYRRKSKGTD